MATQIHFSVLYSMILGLYLYMVFTMIFRKKFFALQLFKTCSISLWIYFFVLRVISISPSVCIGFGKRSSLCLWKRDRFTCPTGNVALPHRYRLRMEMVPIRWQKGDKDAVRFEISRNGMRWYQMMTLAADSIGLGRRGDGVWKPDSGDALHERSEWNRCCGRHGCTFVCKSGPNVYFGSLEISRVGPGLPYFRLALPRWKGNCFFT